MRSLYSLVAIGLLVTSSSVSAADQSRPQPFQPTGNTPILKNVELSAQASLRGQLITSEAVPVANVEIRVITSAGKAVVRTDKDGRFEVEKLKGGQCLLQIEGHTYACRLWMNGTAPPRAMTSIAIVQDDQPLVRGQGRFSRVARLSRVNGGRQVALGLLIAGGTTVAIVAGDTDGS